MPPKHYQRVSFPGLLKKQDESRSAEEDSTQESPQSTPPGVYLRRSSALIAESRLAANSSRLSFSSRSNAPQSSRTTPSTVRSHEATSKRSTALDTEVSPTSRSLRQRQGSKEVSRPGLRDRSAKRSKYEHSLASDADDSDADDGDAEPLQSLPQKTAGAIRAAKWRAKQKAMKENAMRRKLDSSSSEDEPKPEPYRESVEEILSRSPPPDEPEYISNATLRAGFKGFAPLIGGTTMEEKSKIEGELWQKGKLEIPEKSHPEYIKARTEDPGNFAKHLLYEGLDPKSKAPSVAGVDEDPLELDPPGRGGPFDALKFPDRLVEQLNRDDGFTINTWGTAALNRIPAPLMVHIKPEVLAQMPGEVLGRLQQAIRDKLPSDHPFANSQFGKGRPGQTSATTSPWRLSSNGGVVPPKRDESGKFLEAPMRGHGGKFLSKAERAIIASGGTLPPPSPSKSSSLKSKTAEKPKPDGPKHANQYTKAREVKEAKEAATAGFVAKSKPAPQLKIKFKTQANQNYSSSGSCRQQSGHRGWADQQEQPAAKFDYAHHGRRYWYFHGHW